MTDTDRATDVRAAIAKLGRDVLEQIAYEAWRYHVETAVLCPDHDAAGPGECNCYWIDRTRVDASRAIESLLS